MKTPWTSVTQDQRTSYQPRFTGSGPTLPGPTRLGSSCSPPRRQGAAGSQRAFGNAEGRLTRVQLTIGFTRVLRSTQGEQTTPHWPDAPCHLLCKQCGAEVRGRVPGPVGCGCSGPPGPLKRPGPRLHPSGSQRAWCACSIGDGLHSSRRRGPDPPTCASGVCPGLPLAVRKEPQPERLHC